MLILLILLYVLMHFHIIYTIFWTNLPIQCPVPVSVCFVRALQKKVKNKSARKNIEKYPSRKTPEARRTTLIFTPDLKTPNPEPFSPEAIPIFVAIANKLRGIRIPTPVPCRDGELPPDSPPLKFLPPHYDAGLVSPRG